MPHYPPVTAPGTVHALRHLPFVPNALRAEFLRLAAFHANQLPDTYAAELALNTWAIQSGYRSHDHATVFQFLLENQNHEQV